MRETKQMGVFQQPVRFRELFDVDPIRSDHLIQDLYRSPGKGRLTDMNIHFLKRDVRPEDCF
jgi:hypothetical protein